MATVASTPATTDHTTTTATAAETKGTAAAPVNTTPTNTTTENSSAAPTTATPATAATGKKKKKKAAAAAEANGTTPANTTTTTTTPAAAAKQPAQPTNKPAAKGKKGKGGKGDDIDAILNEINSNPKNNTQNNTAKNAAPGKETAPAETAAAAPATPENPLEVSRKSESKPLANGEGDLFQQHIRCLGNWKNDKNNGQTWPEPTIPVQKLFSLNTASNAVTADGKPEASTLPPLPTGQFLTYKHDNNRWRETSEEVRERDRLNSEMLQSIREAAEVHRQVRKFAQTIIKPGISLMWMCNQIEGKVRELLDAKGTLERGVAFPTGCSLNNIAAHWTPNPGDKTILGEGDVMKVDFGSHINGYIVDCAFTVAFDEKYDPLLLAVKEATNAGIAAAGPDARLNEIGGVIQEVMESHEITLNNKVYPIKAIRNLSGHSINRYQIHGGKSVPLIKGAPHNSRVHNSNKMEEGEFFAIETFGSTGKATVVEDTDNCSHYMQNYDDIHNGVANGLRMQSSKQLLNYINKTYDTLAFCKRWFTDVPAVDQKKFNMSLKNLCENNIIIPHPPLVDPVKTSYVAQYEHTFFVGPSRLEVVSRGDDY